MAKKATITLRQPWLALEALQRTSMTKKDQRGIVSFIVNNTTDLDLLVALLRLAAESSNDAVKLSFTRIRRMVGVIRAKGSAIRAMEVLAILPALEKYRDLRTSLLQKVARQVFALTWLGKDWLEMWLKITFLPGEDKELFEVVKNSGVPPLALWFLWWDQTLVNNMGRKEPIGEEAVTTLVALVAKDSTTAKELLKEPCEFLGRELSPDELQQLQSAAREAA